MSRHRVSRDVSNVIRKIGFRRMRNRILLAILWLVVGGTIAVFTLNLLPTTAREFVEEGQLRVAEWKKDISGRSKDDLGRIALETSCADASEWKVRKAPDGVAYWSCNQDDVTAYFGVKSDDLIGQHGLVDCQSGGPITWRVQLDSGNQVTESTDLVRCTSTPQGLVINSFTCERSIGSTGTYTGAASITNNSMTLRNVAIEVTALSSDGVELSVTRSSPRDVTNGTTLTLRVSALYGNFIESFLSNIKYCNVRLVRLLASRSLEEALEGGRYESISHKTASNLELPVLFNPR